MRSIDYADHYNVTIGCKNAGAEIRLAEARLPNRLINRRRIGDLSARGAERRESGYD